MQKISPLFCVCPHIILRMPVSCFAYACKEFCAYPQGCEIPSRSLRKGVSYPPRRLVYPCETLASK